MFDFRLLAVGITDRPCWGQLVLIHGPPLQPSTLCNCLGVILRTSCSVLQSRTSNLDGESSAFLSFSVLWLRLITRSTTALNIRVFSKKGGTLWSWDAMFCWLVLLQVPWQGCSLKPWWKEEGTEVYRFFRFWSIRSLLPFEQRCMNLSCRFLPVSQWGVTQTSSLGNGEV